MVDSINSNNGPQNLNQVNRTANSKSESQKRVDQAGGSAPVDEVQISEEALSLSEAEQTARETRTILEQQLEETLSADGRQVDRLL